MPVPLNAPLLSNASIASTTLAPNLVAYARLFPPFDLLSVHFIVDLWGILATLARCQQRGVEQQEAFARRSFAVSGSHGVATSSLCHAAPAIKQLTDKRHARRPTNKGGGSGPRYGSRQSSERLLTMLDAGCWMLDSRCSIPDDPCTAVERRNARSPHFACIRTHAIPSTLHRTRAKMVGPSLCGASTEFTSEGSRVPSLSGGPKPRPNLPPIAPIPACLSFPSPFSPSFLARPAL